MDTGVWNAALTLGIAILGVAMTLLGWFVAHLNTNLRELDERDRELMKREADFEARCAATYVTKEELNRKGDQWRAALSEIRTKIDKRSN